MTDDAAGPELEELSVERCWQLLHSAVVGRIATIVDSFPVVVPVNYRVVVEPDPWLVLRTRRGGVVSRSSAHVAFEIDGIDTHRQEGWSVLVRGSLHGLHDDSDAVRAHVDPHPWLRAERDLWLAIEPLTVTGRRLHRANDEWAFHPEAYL
jgi:nitroimidazol reductase NimA-like FMN-containing flavoprotein (pyridoxamine 5'-phosphate oxidase superfamily)